MDKRNININKSRKNKISTDDKKETRFVKIKKYNTAFFKPHTHSSPISKIMYGKDSKTS
jgi:hypothetical protein